MILDAACGQIPDVSALSSLLFAVPGVVEHGLFIGMAKSAYIASAGGVRTLKPI